MRGTPVCSPLRRAAQLRHAAARQLHDRLKLRVTVSPQLHEARVVQGRLIALSQAIVNLRSP